MKSVAVAVLLPCITIPAVAETDWVSMTLDNDIFVGKDSGYTNGLYISFFDVGEKSDQIPSHDFWVKPLMWSMPKISADSAVNAYTIGQTLSTPSDIEVLVPSENELPYSAVLALTNTYVTVTKTYADRASTTVGVLGPVAQGEEAQTFVHDILSADEPMGWDTQLENELVFQFTRARIWRSWVPESNNVDILTFVDLGVGTIQSAAGSGAMIRYGRDLISSFSTTLFHRSRTTNPGAINGGWYVYAGVHAGYIFNQIYTDGNTFRDSRSVSYKRELIGLNAGLVYSWHDYSLTIALNDANILQGGNQEDTLENFTQYGTLTFAWRI